VLRRRHRTLIQIVKAFGAEGHAVTSERNRELVLSLGATRAIDYTTTDVTADGATYDVILDCVGHRPVAEVLPALKPGGRLVLIAASLPEMLSTLKPAGEGRKIIAGPARETREQLEALATLASAGQFRPVIDQVFAFEHIAAAHARVETQRKRGSVIVSVSL
jgi:NADPH:quinone reductase-like Zn-dependent oxidoreductase